MRAAGARRAGRTGTAPMAAGAAAAALVLAGCGSAGGVRAGTPDRSTSPRPDCGDVVVTPQAGRQTREVCLSVGRTLRIRLDQGDRPPTEQGAALTEISPGVYRGVRVGPAELSGFRRVCPTAEPGMVSCHAIAGWKVTVDVR